MRQPIGTARNLRSQGQQTRRWRRIKIQVAIGIVFDYERLVLRCQFQHPLAALQCERCTTGVAEGWNQVDQLGLVLHDELFQPVGLHAVRVGRCGDGLRAVQAKALDGGQKGGAFHNHLVAGRNHAFGDQVQRLLAARGDDELLFGYRCALGGAQRGNLLLQWSKAFGGAVLQGRIGPGLQGCARRSLESFHVKQGWIGKTTRKADDAGLTQQLEQFANG